MLGKSLATSSGPDINPREYNQTGYIRTWSDEPLVKPEDWTSNFEQWTPLRCFEARIEIQGLIIYLAGDTSVLLLFILIL